MLLGLLLGAPGKGRERERVGRGPMEQSSFHLVPHYEECSASVTINCEFIFWEFHATLGNLSQEAELMSQLVHTVND